MQAGRKAGLLLISVGSVKFSKATSLLLLNLCSRLSDDSSFCAFTLHNRKSTNCSQYAYNFRKPIGSRGILCDNGNEAVIGQSDSRARIDNMRVALAIDLQPLK